MWRAYSDRACSAMNPQIPIDFLCQCRAFQGTDRKRSGQMIDVSIMSHRWNIANFRYGSLNLLIFVIIRLIQFVQVRSNSSLSTRRSARSGENCNILSDASKRGIADLGLEFGSPYAAFSVYLPPNIDTLISDRRGDSWLRCSHILQLCLKLIHAYLWYLHTFALYSADYCVSDVGIF